MPPKLPRSVQEIAAVIGRDRALFLVGQLPRAYAAGHPSGETILYVPKVLRADHPLVSLLGWACAQKMVRAFGGEILKPAICADLYRGFRDRSIVRLLSEGHKAATIAEWFGVCDRHVRNLVREIPREAANDNVAQSAAQSPQGPTVTCTHAR